MSLNLTILLILKSLLLTLSFTLTTNLYDKRDDLTFPKVNFPFISRNIPASPAYGVYVSELVRYIRACAQYSDFLDRAQLLTQKLTLRGHLRFFGVTRVILYVFTILVPCCDGRYDFRVETMFGSPLPPVICRRAHVVFTSFMFVCHSGNTFVSTIFCNVLFVMILEEIYLYF